MKKKIAKEVGDWMGYIPFSNLSHDSMDCIMIQGAGACSRGPRHDQGPYDTTNMGHDTTGRAEGLATARTRPG